ncbi:hypothetical protein TNIN_257341 [Trichonephila inaurata madagascariensis]|uniref:Uncharacterized protein n=1 Tax=Trichonephila inaurata madagascariensis TaxID=2747483 RepID=A0A8X6XKH3_9ARAC|nr:hypothetical protein TNIN_257341 [Trichonephila inaurata madagascariensis]
MILQLLITVILRMKIPLKMLLNVAQGGNISSDDEKIDEIQCPTSQPEVKGGKHYKKIDLLQNSRKPIPVKTGDALFAVPEKCSSLSMAVSVLRSTTSLSTSSKWSFLL